jgi:predicted ArsR family transcriptional regulator
MLMCAHRARSKEVILETENRNKIMHYVWEDGTTPNTLTRAHLAQLAEYDLVMKRKMPQKGPGRPRFAYALLEDVDGRAVARAASSRRE